MNIAISSLFGVNAKDWAEKKAIYQSNTVYSKAGEYKFWNELTKIMPYGSSVGQIKYWKGATRIDKQKQGKKSNRKTSSKKKSSSAARKAP